MSLVFVFGSGECEQLGLGDDQPLEIKKPRRLPIFDLGGLVGNRILKIVCGGMHTAALSNQGKVYTWGCNDEGALGRTGPENQPLQVSETLNILVTDITAGDCHTIAYNQNLNQIFIWGLYRNAMTGRTYDPVKEPTRIGQELFDGQKKKSIQKITSGAHHSLALTTDGEIYGWGDPESGKIGRMLKTRNRNEQALRIEKIHAKHARDIFCGNHHSFYINRDGKVFSWGLNNHGQLGIGHKENISKPTHISQLDGQNVTLIAGGEHHSIAVTIEGKVYCWGRNDEGQCGRGDLYGAYRKRKAQEEYERMMKEEEEKQKAEEERQRQAEEAKKHHVVGVEEEKQGKVEGLVDQTVQQEEEEKVIPQSQVALHQELAQSQIPQSQKKKNARKAKKTAEEAHAEKEEDLVNVGYFFSPQLVNDLWDELDPAKQHKISSVYASGNYCYALEVTENPKSNQLYSWGMGSSYVLGNRDEENEFKPYKVHPKMFEEFPVREVGLGTQHVVVLTTDNLDSKDLPEFEAEVLNFQLPPEEKKQPSPKKVGTPGRVSQNGQENKKRKREEFEQQPLESIKVVQQQNHQQEPVEMIKVQNKVQKPVQEENKSNNVKQQEKKEEALQGKKPVVKKEEDKKPATPSQKENKKPIKKRKLNEELVQKEKKVEKSKKAQNEVIQKNKQTPTKAQEKQAQDLKQKPDAKKK